MDREKNQEYNEENELHEHHRFSVDCGQRPLRIDKYLADKLADTSRTRIQSAADAGNILVNGQPVKPSYKVRPGDTISILLPHPPRESGLIPEDIPLNIIHEDNHCLVVDKEAGMVVHPGVGNFSGTLINALAHHLQHLPLFETGELRPGLVHRIDKNTSGILVIAKTETALNKLARQFYNRETDRRYTAMIWGIPGEKEGRIEGHIGRSPKDRKKMHVFPGGTPGKPAVTHYRVTEELGHVSLVECKLETGRTHQIRVHFQYIGHPLFNDETYGGDQILRGTRFTKYRQFIHNCFRIMPRHALHARSLSFDHPATGKRMHFESPLPEDFTRVIEKWRTYLSGRDIP